MKMVGYFVQGFLMGLAYLAPIGMQNLYVINSALRATLAKAYQVAFIVTLFDMSLSLSAFWGTGVLLEAFPLLKWGFYLLGSIIITLIGIALVRSRPANPTEIQAEESFFKTVVFAFTVSWLNPHALIDSTFLLGGYRAMLDQLSSILFLSGVISASIVWFFGLVTIVARFRKQVNTGTMRLINVVCGVTIILFGLNLGYKFFTNVFTGF
jgi:L-lysine exporter family protein LysE/ArgO